MTQFSKSLKDRYPQANKLENFDFSEVRLAYLKEKEEKKSRPEEEKAKIKQEKDEDARYHGYSIVDGTFSFIQEPLKKLTGIRLNLQPCSKGEENTPKLVF